MPLHDWTRVQAYVYHDFHTGLLVAIRRVLNDGVLPPGYYARAEQTLRTMGPDVLTLQSREPVPPGGGVVLTVPTAPPRVAIAATGAPRVPAFRQKRLAIRHTSDDRLVAIVELVSPGSKASAQPLREFVRKIGNAVDDGIHALVIDPFPPGRRDPNGVHGVIWPRLGGDDHAQPADKPLTLAAYESGDPVGRPHRCYAQPATRFRTCPSSSGPMSTSTCRWSGRTKPPTPTCFRKTARSSNRGERRLRWVVTHP